MSAAVLYTPGVLALATRLADYPWDDTLPLRGQARSRSCGSALELALSLDGNERIARVAMRSHACAIGQAAAAIFADAAPGRTLADVSACRAQIARWLGGEGPLPDWPGLDAIAAARDYPARHAAIMLAWQAADDLLPTMQNRR